VRKVRKVLNGASLARLPQTALTLNQLKFWDENGFLIVKGLIPEKLVSAVNAEIETTVQDRRKFPNVKIDVLTGPLAGKRMPIAEAPDEVFSGSLKLNDLYLDSAILRRAVLSDQLVAILSALLDGDPIVINSLNFTRGSQQPSHFDTWYMPPPVTNKLVVSSICLEDLHPDAGPLFYYPGSHTIPPYKFSHGGIHAIESEMSACRAYLESEIASRGLRKTAFLGAAGDVFLWHAQLLHGGLPVRNWTRTRKSLVTHYWRKQDVPSEKVALVDGDKYFYKRPHQA
jgi:ectoine hydroxylase-related dioxygenase (phytanoyl-CoA dioxygenase family)